MIKYLKCIPEKLCELADSVANQNLVPANLENASSNRVNSPHWFNFLLEYTLI